MRGQLVLVRHGSTARSAEGRHTGYTDLPLDARGETQAATVRDALRGRRFTTILTSPRIRARDTARLAGLTPAEVNHDLREWDYGGYEGLRTDDIDAGRRRRGLGGWWLWSDGVPEGETPGEDAAQVGHRADRVLGRTRALLADGDVALVAHGHVLRVLAARWLGLPARSGALLALDPGRACLLDHEHDRPVVRLWNAAPGDPALHDGVYTHGG